ncbi:MAG: addiction module toxin, HicA family [Candidatus Aminicenantes bacterium]|nr:addiction module toxin, HicA family [Candidatus Aminicenantes bacterium]
MRLPRDVSGDELGKRLGKLGYEITRQTGSHMRLTKITKEGDHHITIPKHKDLKLGTLNSIVKDVAEHLGIARDELVRKLWY